ncbi:hypothetical protein LINPERHAP2_LOCUS32531, partial [Linum perenne]
RYFSHSYSLIELSSVYVQCKMNDAAVFSTWLVGALFSVVGIVFDAVAATRAIVREKSSSHYAESCYIRFIGRALHLANYGLEI